MKKYLIGVIIGFFALPLLGALIVFASYGVAPFYIFHRVFIASPPPEDHRLARYGDESSGFLETKSPFITEPGVQAYQGGIRLFRLDPVIHLRDSPDFETCFTVTGLETDIFENTLGLKVFLAEEEQKALKAALEVNDLDMFVLEEANRVTRFHTDRDDEPKKAYMEKLQIRPNDADFTFIARE